MLSLLLMGCPKPLSVNDVYNEQADPKIDEGVHVKNSLEWWYFTGDLNEIGTDSLYGIEYVFFHFNPRDKHDYIMANFAISNPQDSSFHYDYVLIRSDSILQPNLPLDLKLPYEDQQWTMTGQLGKYQLTAEMISSPGYAFSLHTSPEQQVWLHGGGKGYQEYGEYTSAGYYSYPKLKTRGKLKINGAEKEVEGTLWYDRQWNCIGVYQKQVAWDWMAIKLGDQGNLMIFKLYHRADGRVVYGGSYLDQSGNNQEINTDQIEIIENAYWRSPESGISYPVDWTVRIPHMNLELSVTARFPKQELILKLAALVKLHYWEGMCRVRGNLGEIPVQGTAYVEVTNRKRKEP